MSPWQYMPLATSPVERVDYLAPGWEGRCLSPLGRRLWPRFGELSNAFAKALALPGYQREYLDTSLCPHGFERLAVGVRHGCDKPVDIGHRPLP